MKAATRTRLRRETLALLRLAEQPVTASGDTGRMTLTLPNGSHRVFPVQFVSALVSSGALEHEGGVLRRTEAGNAMLRRLSAEDDGHAAQHRVLESRVVEGVEGKPARALVNLADSPLARFARRKGEDGKPYLRPEHVEAGERLRADFERAQIRQRVTVNWDVSARQGPGQGGGQATITDAAIAARSRWNAAVAALTSDFGDAVVDLCCFDKGLSEIEADRGWPRRSGKIMLRAGLELLHRHYRG